MLKCEDVWVSLPHAGDVLRGVSVEVGRGEVVAILGPNGAGKTTLLLVLAGLVKPKRGRVLLDGAELSEQLPGARRRIGLLFQDPDDQLFNPTVLDELMFTLDQLSLSGEEKRVRVYEVSRALGIEKLLEKPVHALSFGEKRRVALASILVYNPDFLLLDEPTANLDAGGVNALVSVVCTARSQGKGVLLATQDVELAHAVADRVYVLAGGSVVWSGAPPAPRGTLEAVGLWGSIAGCRSVF